MKFTIRLKLLTGFLLILILASLVQGFVFFSTNQYISTQIIDFQKLQAKKGASEIQKFFTNLSTEGISLVDTYQKDRKNFPATSKYVLKNNTYIKEIAVLSPSGKELMKFDTKREIPQGGLSYEVFSDAFHRAVAGTTSISKVYYIEAGLGPYIDFFLPIFEDNNKVAGIIKMQINLTLLSDELRDIKLGENGYIYVVDNEGRLITHPSQSFILQRPNLSFRQVITDALSNAESSQEQQYINENNIPVVAQAVRIPGFNWVAVFEQPIPEAFGFLTFIRNLFIITIVGSTFVLLLLAFTFSESLTRPIRKLQKSVQEIEQGNKNKTVIVKSGDEIESLSISFASLLKQLFQREHALQQLTIQLEKANKKLKELDKLKSEFVSLAAHELRTPMTSIHSYLWMAIQGKGGPLNEKQQYYIERSFNSVNRLMRLVNDMLNISRIESGKITINLQATDLVKLAQDVVEEVIPRANELGVKIVLEKSEGLPLVLADADKIKEVFFNLIGNSLKFTPKGGSITVSFTQKDGFVETKIVDTGSGIDPQDMGKLFQRFGLIPGSYITNRTAVGTGLGLYICRSIINLHHGEITAESEGRGKGSTFTFTLKVFDKAEMRTLKIESSENKKGKMDLIHVDI